MQVTIELPDDLGKKFQSLPQGKKLQKKITHHFSQIVEEENLSSPSTSVEKLLVVIENPELDLNGDSGSLKQGIREFREGFQFEHDQ